jgi:hypothetical protein
MHTQILCTLCIYSAFGVYAYPYTYMHMHEKTDTSASKCMFVRGSIQCTCMYMLTSTQKPKIVWYLYSSQYAISMYVYHENSQICLGHLPSAWFADKGLNFSGGSPNWAYIDWELFWQCSMTLSMSATQFNAYVTSKLLQVAPKFSMLLFYEIGFLVRYLTCIHSLQVSISAQCLPC